MNQNLQLTLYVEKMITLLSKGAGSIFLARSHKYLNGICFISNDMEAAQGFPSCAEGGMVLPVQ